MNAADALQRARAAGVHVRIDGNALVLDAAAAPPPDVLNLLALHKAQVVALVRPGRDGWSGEDWRVFFDERAGITAFDGGLAQEEAEARAFACCVAEWLNRNPVLSEPGRCLGCGGIEHRHEPLLPFGIESTGHAWLHARCWSAWYAKREADAAAALSTFGIPNFRITP